MIIERERSAAVLESQAGPQSHQKCNDSKHEYDFQSKPDGTKWGMNERRNQLLNEIITVRY